MPKIHQLQTAHPELAVTPSADWQSGRLRADPIRRSLILALAREWAEAETNVITALDRLAAVQAGNPTAAELDAAVAAVEACTDDDVHVDIDLGTAVRLHTQLDSLIDTLARFNPAAATALKAVTA